MEKFKIWVSEHKAAAGGLLGLVLVVIYYLYKKMSGSSDSSGEEYSAAGMVYNPANPGGSGGGGSDNSTAILEAVKQGQEDQAESNRGFFEGLTSTLSSAFTGMSDTMANAISSQNQAITNFMEKSQQQQTSQFSSLKDIVAGLSSAVSTVTAKMNTPTVMMPTIPATSNYDYNEVYTEPRKSTGSSRGSTKVKNKVNEQVYEEIRSTGKPKNVSDLPAGFDITAYDQMIREKMKKDNPGISFG